MFPSKSDKRRKRGKGGGQKKLAAIIAVVLLLAAGIVAYFVFFNNGADSLSSLELRIPHNATISAGNDSIYYLNDKTLGCVDYSNNEMWSVSLSTSDLTMNASNEIIALYNSNSLWLYGFDGNTYFSEPLTFSGIIEEVRCGSSLVMVLYVDNDRTMIIDTINTRGERIGEPNKLQERHVIDFGFPSGDSSYIYSIDVGSVTTVSRVSTRNEQQADTGNIPVIGQLLQKVIFRNDGIFAVGTHQVKEFDYIGNEKSDHLIYGWKYIDDILNDQQQTYILFAPGGDTALDSYISTARLHTPDKTDISIQLNAGTKQLFLGENRIYSFTSDKMISYSFDGSKQGEFPANYDDEVIDYVIKAPYNGKNNRALICTDKAVYSVRLP